MATDLKILKNDRKVTEKENKKIKAEMAKVRKENEVGFLIEKGWFE